MLSTPFICCSIGVATACVRVFASAPGDVAGTRISGGTIFGNCEVGSDASDTTPRMTVTMAMTIATIGRLMKNFDMDYLPAGLAVDPLLVETPAPAAAEVDCSCALMEAPSRSFCRLSIMTSAPAETPEFTTQLVPICGPSSTVST